MLESISLSTVLQVGGLFGVAKLIEILVLRYWSRRDKKGDEHITIESKRIDELVGFRKDLLDRVKLLEQAKNEADKRYYELYKESAGVKIENSSINADKLIMAKELDSLRNQNFEQAAEIGRLQQENTKQAGEIKQLRSELNATEKALAETRKQLEHITARVEALADRRAEDC